MKMDINFDDSLLDTNSEKYRQLSQTLKDNLTQAIQSSEDLKNTEIKNITNFKFSKGSVIATFLVIFSTPGSDISNITPNSIKTIIESTKNDPLLKSLKIILVLVVETKLEITTDVQTTERNPSITLTPTTLKLTEHSAFEVSTEKVTTLNQKETMKHTSEKPTTKFTTQSPTKVTTRRPKISSTAKIEDTTEYTSKKQSTKLTTQPPTKVTQPSTTVSTERPTTESTAKTEETSKQTTEEPTTKLTTQPSTTVSTERPTTESTAKTEETSKQTTEEPTTKLTTQPSTTVSTERPTTESTAKTEETSKQTTEEPTTKLTTQPSTTVSTERPTTESTAKTEETSKQTTEEPTTKLTTQPSTTVSTERPTTESTAKTEETSKQTTEEPTTKLTTQPSTTVSTERPTTESTAKTEETSKQTTEEPTTKLTTQPSTTVSTERPTTESTAKTEETSKQTTEEPTTKLTTQPSTTVSTERPTTESTVDPMTTTYLHPCDREVCNNGTCLKRNTTDFECECLPGWTGELCANDTNECTESGLCNYGECINLPGSYRCDCDFGYEGNYCNKSIFCKEEDLGKILQHPISCEKYLNCTAKNNHAVVDCPSQYKFDTISVQCSPSGATCNEPEKCTNVTCNGGTCLFSSKTYKIQCTCDKNATEFYGDRCQYPKKSCNELVCQNGKGIDTGKGYCECVCDKGWTKKDVKIFPANDTCDEDIDECANLFKCGKENQCTNFNGSFSCLCSPDWFGNECHKSVHCNSRSDGLYPHYDCDKAFHCRNHSHSIEKCNVTGQVFDHKNGVCFNPGLLSCNIIERCTKTTCNNHGTCSVDINGGNPKCHCDSFYYGTTCNYTYNACDSIKCQNNAQIEKMTLNDTFCKCNCQTGWTGQFCEDDINECNNQTIAAQCGEDNTCTNTKGSFTCECSEAWRGDKCDESWYCNKKTDGVYRHTECSKYVNCTSGVHKIENCPIGQTFDVDKLECVHSSLTQCETIERCKNSTCNFHGECVDSIETPPNCTCYNGFYGTYCENKLLNCSTLNCTHGTKDVVDSTEDLCKCQCIQGYNGQFCTEDIDECEKKPSPCGSDNKCTNKIGSFECECAEAWNGVSCDKSWYCNNKTDGVYRHTECSKYVNCTSGVHKIENCVIGQTFDVDKLECVHSSLTQCETIERCKNSTCNFHGECVDSIETPPNCTCYNGYYGTYCENELLNCSTLNCTHGTKDVVDSTEDLCKCQCIQGYDGQFCTEDINECEKKPRPCGSDNICTNKIGSFECECAEAWNGVNCDKSWYCNNKTDGVYRHTECSKYVNCTSGVHKIENCVIGQTFDVDKLECVHSSLTQCEPIERCKNTTCNFHGECVDSIETPPNCTCYNGYYGTYCENKLLNCSTLICTHGTKYVVDSTEDLCKCQCIQGYDGQFCTEDIDECEKKPSPCGSDNKCTNKIGSFECECTEDWNGVSCDKSWYCNNKTDGVYRHTECSKYVNCTSGVHKIENCVIGQTFDVDKLECVHSSLTQCEPIERCKNSTCSFHGECVDSIETPPKCTCYNGFYGTYCENKLLNCSTLNCTHGTKDVVDSTEDLCKCQCIQGYNGQFCTEDINECEKKPSPCGSDNKCTNKIGSFECECSEAWNGVNCDKSWYCNNKTDGVYRHTECSKYVNCTSGVHKIENCVIGQTFDVDKLECVHSSLTQCKPIERCLMSTCNSNGVCFDGPEISPNCSCDPLYYGSFCEYKAMNCSTLSCSNGLSEVLPASSGLCKCQCSKGYKGQFCSEDIDECSGEIDPCGMDNKCNNTFGSFKCECSEAWKGDVCEKSWYCDQEVNGIYRHTDCSKFVNCTSEVHKIEDCFVGQTFDVDKLDCVHSSLTECKPLDRCDASTCKNGGRCEETRNYVKCHCDNHYYGEYCHLEAETCNNLTCGNGNKKSLRLDYCICDCNEGWTGPRCLTDVNECVLLGEKACSNAANNCTNIEGSFTCQCSDDWMGSNCSESFFCSNRTDGLYRHQDCSKSVSCSNQIHTINSCPSTWLWNGNSCQNIPADQCTNKERCSYKVCPSGKICVEDANDFARCVSS
ncbi:DgyrCDS2130 [Dimorphilus gyrociliatus]|nr:DgyrCDS2130 [Dimorphilus gyrociliatus]